MIYAHFRIMIPRKSCQSYAIGIQDHSYQVILIMDTVLILGYFNLPQKYPEK